MHRAAKPGDFCRADTSIGKKNDWQDASFGPMIFTLSILILWGRIYHLKKRGDSNDIAAPAFSAQSMPLMQ